MIWSRLAAAGLTLCAILLGSSARGQSVSRLPTPPDDARKVLALAESAIAAANYSEAVARLQELLDSPEDYFRLPGGGTLKGRVDELFAALPAEGRAAYERLYGPTARALLDKPDETHDLDAWSEVARRFFWTEAGRDAALALVWRLSDEGDTLAAARLCDRLAQHPALGAAQRGAVLQQSAVCWWLTGASDVALERLVMRSRLPPVAASVLPRDAAAAVAWLNRSAPVPSLGAEDAEFDVQLFRGNARRNSLSQPAAPVGDMAWSHPAIDEYDDWDGDRIKILQERVEWLQREYPATDARHDGLFPAGVPLVSRGIAVFRGFNTVKAIVAATGQFKWSAVYGDDTFEYLVSTDAWRPTEEWHQGVLNLFLSQRMWRDVTSASLSTDGANLYSIADGGMLSSLSQAAFNMPKLSTHPLAPHPYNRLLAFELRSGLFQWEAGGPAGAFDGELDGVHFLSAPLPWRGSLYCLIEDRGQLRLVVLDPRDGSPRWSQALYNPDVNLSNVTLGIERRMAGLAPAISGDILVCPTGETRVVAIDPRRRELLWHAAYRNAPEHSPQQANIRMLMLRQQQFPGRMLEEQLASELLTPDHWADAAPVIAGNYVLLTPPDAHELICLRLSDGAELWRRDRGDARFIAAVDAGRVILVGNHAVSALRLETGEPAWPEAISIAAPAGRGVRHGGCYLLPLTSGEIVSIDLEQARVIARSPVPEGTRLGNLVAAEGRLLSQGPDGLCAFHSLEELSTQTGALLAADPHDARGLAIRGEVGLHLQQRARALDDLRRSFAADPQPRTRLLLANTLLAELREDFDAARGTAVEIETLVAGTPQAAQFHRLYAEGLRASGEVEAAFRQYLRLADETTADGEMQQIDGVRSVRTDRWIRGKLAEMLETSDFQARAALEAVLARTMDETLARGEAARIESLLALLPLSAQTNSLRQAAARIVGPAAGGSAWEYELMQRAAADAPEPAAQATAQLADAWLSASQRSPLLSRLLNRLGGPLADVPCLGQITGNELLTAWRRDPARAAIIDAPPLWPTTYIEPLEDAGTAPAQLMPTTLLGRPSELLRGWTFFTDAAGAWLFAYDQDGRLRWRTALRESGATRGRRGINYVRYVSTQGRQALVVAQDQFVLIDALADGAIVANERLFAVAELPPSPGVIIGRPPRGAPFRAVPGARRQIDAAGGLAPLTSETLVYQAGSELRAISPWNGQLLWTHAIAGLDPGCELLADDEYIVVWPAQAGNVTLLRASDGEFVRMQPLPSQILQPQPDGRWGRCLVFNATDPGGAERLGLYDPVSDSSVWTSDATDLFEWSVVDGQDFWLLRRDGSLRVLAGLTGRTLLTSRVPLDPLPEMVSLQRDRDCYFATTFHAPDDHKSVLTSAIMTSPEVNGQVLRIDADSGEIRWTRPIGHQRIQTQVPGNWPVLVFAALVVERTPAYSRQYVALTMLDKQTGAVLMSAEKPGTMEILMWSARPEEQTLSAFAAPIAASFRFHAEPPAALPAPPREVPPAPPAGDAPQAADEGSPTPAKAPSPQDR